MSLTRLVITTVVVQKRPVREVAAQYGVSRSWLYELLTGYRVEGEAAFEARFRRPKSTPNATPTETVDLITEIRQKLTTTGLDAGPDTIGWHLEHHHGRTVSRAHHRRAPGHRRTGHPRTEEEAEVLLHPLPSRPAQRVLAGRLHPLPAHPPRGPTRRRHRDPVLARRPLPLRPVRTRPPPSDRTNRARRVPQRHCHPRDPGLHAYRQRHGVHHPPVRRQPARHPRSQQLRGRAQPPRRRPEELPPQPPQHLRQSRAVPADHEEVACRPVRATGHPRPTPGPHRPVRR